MKQIVSTLRFEEPACRTSSIFPYSRALEGGSGWRSGAELSEVEED